MRQTIYMVFDESEDSMGCRCCRTQPNERILGLYANEEDAKAELKNLAKQDEDSGYKVKWDMDTSFESLGEDDHVVHQFALYTQEVIG